MAVSVSVVGPGAIGGTIAAWLSLSPLVGDLTLCARTPLERLVVQTPDGDVIEARPRIVLDPVAITAAVDWVLVATKAYEIAAVARWLAPLVGPETRVAVLQNGVEHVERFAPFLSADRILPVVVDLPAERSAPGRIVQIRPGLLTVPAGPDGDAFAALFAAGEIDVGTTDDFLSAAWEKLCVNCAGAVNALTDRPGEVVHAPGVADLMRGLVRECIAVGRAVGAQLDDALADQVVERARNSPSGSVHSLLADRRVGRPLEWDARNGVIVRLGAVHGVPTPLNGMASVVLAAMAGEPSA